MVQGFAVLIFVLLPEYCRPAMNALSNTGLGQVQADAGSPGMSPAMETGPAVGGAPLLDNSSAQAEAAGNDMESKIKAFRSSPEYSRFIQGCRQLEKLAKRDDYPTWAKSKGFQLFCSRLEKMSRQCNQKLAELKQQAAEQALHPFIALQEKILQKIDRFTADFNEYYNGQGLLPDIKKLMEDLRADSADHPRENTACD